MTQQHEPSHLVGAYLEAKTKIGFIVLHSQTQAPDTFEPSQMLLNELTDLQTLCLSLLQLASSAIHVNFGVAHV